MTSPKLNSCEIKSQLGDDEPQKPNHWTKYSPTVLCVLQQDEMVEEAEDEPPEADSSQGSPPGHFKIKQMTI